MNLLDTIQQKYGSMSPVEKKIADYILEDPAAIINSTIIYVAAETGVSEGSISKFANMLGLRGFTQLKINLAQCTSQEDRRDATDALQLEIGSAKAYFKQMMDRANASFASTFDKLGGEIENAVQILSKANLVIVIGVGHSKSVASDIAIRLMRIGVRSYAEADPLLSQISISQLGPEDAVFAVSNSGRTKEIISAVAIAKTVGAKTIALTSHSDSPLTNLSDVSLISLSTEAAQYREPTTARLTQLMIGDAIIESLIHNLGEDGIGKLDRVVELYEEHREAVKLNRKGKR